MARRAEATATGGADSTSRCCSTTYDAIVEVASRLLRHESGWTMREIESSLQPFGEFLLRGLGARRFLTRKASDEPLADQVRRFCEDLERKGQVQEWQVRQAEQALRMILVNFLKRTDWHRRPASAVVDEHGRTNPLAALEELQRRIRTRHYSSRTERTYADWIRRFFAYRPTSRTDHIRGRLERGARLSDAGCGGGEPILHGEGQTWVASAGRPEHSGDRCVAGRAAREDLAHGRADLRGRIAGL